jgi:hypothetical protein
MTIVIFDRSPAPYADWLRDADTDVAAVRGDAAVLDLARTRQITAIVATAAADLVRAGALRDRLGVPGQSRAQALAFTDIVHMRNLLTRHGIPTIPCGQLAGRPVRVRARKAPWDTVAVLRGETYAGGANLVAEPVLHDLSRLLVGPEHATLRATVDSVLPGARTIRGLRAETGEWLIDTVACDVPETADLWTHRAAVRAQAGLNLEVAR